MVYVALLRGINVGGKNKVNMKDLAAAFEEAGMASVRTYINSGNVIFSSTSRAAARLQGLLTEAVARRFGWKIALLVRDVDNMRRIVDAIPDQWANDEDMKCDVMFLWDEVDRPSILKQVQFKPEIEDVRYVPGAVIWRADRQNVTRSGYMKLIGTPLYKQMTIRNCNTTRKLLELMAA